MCDLPDIRPRTETSRRLLYHVHLIHRANVGIQALAPFTTLDVYAGLKEVIDGLIDLQQRSTGLLAQLVDHENREAAVAMLLADRSEETEP